jgi:hypothetical protein
MRAIGRIQRRTVVGDRQRLGAYARRQGEQQQRREQRRV